MRKFAILIMAFCLGMQIPAFSQSLSKALDKEYKNKLKEYKKDGWKVDSDRSAEVVLLKHFSKLDNEGLKTIPGVVRRCKSTNVCRQVALQNAQTEYAKLISSKIKGAFGTVIRADANRPQEEIDKTVGGVTNDLEADVSGALEPAYSIYRDAGDVTLEYKTYFYRHDEKILNGLQGVLEQSMKETKLTIEEARSISKFVNDELNNANTGE